MASSSAPSREEDDSVSPFGGWEAMVNLPTNVSAEEIAIIPLHLANTHSVFIYCLKLVDIHAEAVETGEQCRRRGRLTS